LRRVLDFAGELKDGDSADLAVALGGFPRDLDASASGGLGR
jgi:hypothetical protein